MSNVSSQRWHSSGVCLATSSLTERSPLASGRHARCQDSYEILPQEAEPGARWAGPSPLSYLVGTMYSYGVRQAGPIQSTSLRFTRGSLRRTLLARLLVQELLQIMKCHSTPAFFFGFPRAYISEVRSRPGAGSSLGGIPSFAPSCFRDAGLWFLFVAGEAGTAGGPAEMGIRVCTYGLLTNEFLSP